MKKPHIRRRDIFPVFDPVTERFLYYKPRVDVHRDGDWHRAIQANIIRQNELGTFDILLQKRSDQVDIGRSKYDQSLATQMILEDPLNSHCTLKRGLIEELGVSKYKFHRLFNSILIIKTYTSQEDIVNRELLTLFLVAVNDAKTVEVLTSKIDSIKWLEWNIFLGFFDLYKYKFTKTSQMYFSNVELRKEIEEASVALLSGKINSKMRKMSKPIKMLHIARMDDTPKNYKLDLSNLKATLEEDEMSNLA